MRFFTPFLLFVACTNVERGTGESENHTPQAENTWPANTWTVELRLDNLQVGYSSSHLMVGVRTPAAGETCVTAWDSYFLGGGPTADRFTIPVEPEPGMELVIPGRDTPVLGSRAWFPPAWPDDNGQWWGWYGGAWTFDQWDEQRLSISLADGELCQIDSFAYLPEVPVCLPDAGTIEVFGIEGLPLDLNISEVELEGRPSSYIDPRSGGLLCDW